jgi:hypothetical protein
MLRGTLDGQPFQSAFMSMDDGTHKLPIKADLRKAIGKDEGDTVTMRLLETLELSALLRSRFFLV